MVSVPTFGMLDVEWVTRFMALAGPENSELKHCWPVDMPVAEARNRTVEAALQRECDSIFFVDYDVLIEPSALTRLAALGLPVAGGLYYTKSDPPEPVALVDGRPISGWESGDVVAVDVIGMGCTLLDVGFLKEMGPPWFATTDNAEMVNGEPTRTRSTEDAYFCERVTRETDAKPCVDTGILCGHKDLKTGKVFLPATEKRTIIDLTKKGSEPSEEAGAVPADADAGPTG